MPAVLASLLVSGATSAIAYAMTEAPPDAQNSSLDAPACVDGMVIPVVFGTCTVKKTNGLWYGDVSTHDIIANGGK